MSLETRLPVGKSQDMSRDLEFDPMREIQKYVQNGEPWTMKVKGLEANMLQRLSVACSA